MSEGAMNDEQRLRQVEGALGAHLAECTLQNKMLWHEIRGLKRAQWAAVGSMIMVLLACVAVLIRAHLKL